LSDACAGGTMTAPGAARFRPDPFHPGVSLGVPAAARHSVIMQQPECVRGDGEQQLTAGRANRSREPLVLRCPLRPERPDV
jgi:hypothetical protein